MERKDISLEDAIQSELGSWCYNRERAAGKIESVVLRYQEKQGLKGRLRAKDTEKRMEIQARIRQLKDQGFPIEETLTRIRKEFPNTQYEGFFNSWIENAYKPTRTPQKAVKENEGEER